MPIKTLSTRLDDIHNLKSYTRTAVVLAVLAVILTYDIGTGLFELSLLNLVWVALSVRAMREYKTEPAFCPEWAATSVAFSLMFSLVFAVFGLIAA